MVSKKFKLGVLGVAMLALAGCGIANPWPTVGSVPSKHHNILLLGDSILGNANFWLPRVLAAQGIDATIYDEHVNASGLVDPINGKSPLDFVKSQIAAHPDTDTVVLEWAGACAICNTGQMEYGSQQFYDTWRTNAHAIIDYLHSVGGGGTAAPRLMWVVTPPMPQHPEDPTGHNQVLTNGGTVLAWMDKADFIPRAGAGADWWAALSDTNAAYQQFLLYDGAVHQVRTDDLVHLTEDGAYRAALWTTAALAELYRG
jgi:hypothetical protein